ncbi:hypothetical protein EV655_1361 [Rhodovulum euryhalinum]|uniref:Uncharacterized protein n=1 Tax=Rhodovulum euryhalinum TaxID=35805 RepID=A0A4R2K7P1_9RHOB|nr:hypothetical protein EV655_1361 [Rhodovulum euryhalinum]
MGHFALRPDAWGRSGRSRAPRAAPGRRARRGAMAALAVCVIAGSAHGQDRPSTILHNENGLTLRWHLQAAIYAVSETNLFWDLAATTSPGSGFDPDTNWLESYIKPGLSFEYQLDTGAMVYGKLSAVASYTWGTDAFDTGDTGATTLEEAYLAIRGDLGGGLSYDLSLGPRELTLGTGMLIANGATSGFERGALKLGPRKAWEMAAIGHLSYGNVTGTAFYLDPNELPSTDGNNELAGVDLRYDDPRGGYLGATFVDVLKSNSSYPQAAPGGVGAPTVTPGAREGTRTLGIYGKTNPFEGALENWAFTGEVALQRNDRIDLEAWGGRVTAGYTFADLPPGRRASPWATRPFLATTRTRRSSKGSTRSITRAARAPGPRDRNPPRPSSIRT